MIVGIVTISVARATLIDAPEPSSLPRLRNERHKRGRPVEIAEKNATSLSQDATGLLLVHLTGLRQTIVSRISQAIILRTTLRLRLADYMASFPRTHGAGGTRQTLNGGNWKSCRDHVCYETCWLNVNGHRECMYLQ